MTRWVGMGKLLRISKKSVDHPIDIGKLLQLSDKIGVLDSLSDVDRPAIYSTLTTEFITHRQLKQSIESFKLPTSHFTAKKPVVAVALPNGPLLAAGVLAVSTYYVAAPVTPNVGIEQFKSDVIQAGATLILTTQEDYKRLALHEPWVSEAGVQVCFASLNSSMNLVVTDHAGQQITDATSVKPNQQEDTCIQLFTSGTSGNKKIVPISMNAVINGAQMVIESWGLTQEETCLNMMPLHHVGGIIRNVFAPIFAGGSTICCPAFDPGLFWDLVDQGLPSWYYASPTMHSLILDEGSRRPLATKNSRIRLICNAAGGLLPSLACQLQDTFNCTVLPSYGMTECMPISTPPLNYKLDRTGTSGQTVGPELAILNAAHENVPPHTIGRISVRGSPLFSGYLKPDGSLDKSAFNPDGWFDTGDLGYMDEEGYLFITGRSKEVINRGGEIISPFEVENAIVAEAADQGSSIYGRVTQALAFGVSHDVLQEAVAVVLVTPEGCPRVDIRALHQSLKSRLQQAKLPALVVYMDDVPKRNNKVLRTNMAKRLGLPEQTGETPFLEKHWEAQCPPLDTPLAEPIPASQCTVEVNQLTQAAKESIPSELDIYIDLSAIDQRPEIFVVPKAGFQVSKDAGRKACEDLKQLLSNKVHNYNIPEDIQYFEQKFPTRDDGLVDAESLRLEMQRQVKREEEMQPASIEETVRLLFARVLSKSIAAIDLDADFFNLGGDSILAGRLLSEIRTQFKISVPIEFVFNSGSPNQIAKYLEAEGACVSGSDSSSSSSTAGDDEGNEKSYGPEYSSANPFLMILQLLPMVFFYPARRAFQWTVFLVMLSTTLSWPTNDSVIGRLFVLLLSILIAKAIALLVIPWVGIAAKWIIIGRYREGLYPMWGPYHTRWWMVQKIREVCGMGWFGSTNWSRITYHRLMGAKIGANVALKGVKLGEWDLLTIGDGAVLEGCVVRPFAGEKNATMYLGRITIGSNVVVCKTSIVAPGTSVPDNTCIGPNSSSWELEDASEEYRDLARSRLKSSSWVLHVFGTIPLSFLSYLITLIPWVLGLVGLVMTQPVQVTFPVLNILNWFASDGRIAYHFLALVLRTVLSPYFAFVVAVAVRWALDKKFGKLQPGPERTRSQIDRWRMSLIKTLMPGSKLHEMTEMLGQHYEGTSIAMRLLGGKVGKRVYWPGTGPVIDDYHLIDIGNDVVFGSRSHIITSDGISSEKVIIGDNAMIADRVTLLPGVTVGQGTVLGSGALTRRNKFYDDNTTWVGSRAGDAICLTRSQPKKSDYKKAEDMGFVVDETSSSSASSPVEPSEKTGTFGFSSHEVLDSSASSTICSVNQTSNSNKQHGLEEKEEANMSPFGRAFYQGKAPYRVLGEKSIVLYSTLITTFAAAYWNVTFIWAIQAVFFLGFDQYLGRTFWHDALMVWGFMTASIAVITTILAIGAVTIVIAAKWILIGRRTPGNYSWDESSYCQRWQIYLSIERIRRHCFRGSGVLGMLTGTHWLVLYFRALGAKIGKNCALFVNGQPSLMFTEPDLLTLGDRVVVDDASLVGHINTRGRFDLNELHVGNRCVLRTGSRLLSGASMMDGSCLMEHTLVMGGDVVDKNATLQGWPARVFRR
ncbi:hypothetical protein BX600DRAFT_538526 [Xylariales sp. PMI_506]|nr:hypothetical protein BX600DRAFT_538526 [Xylariales sp. PMI_506]